MLLGAAAPGEASAAFPAGPCRGAGDAVGGFWFARLLGTRWGKASNFHELSISPQWGIHDLSCLFLLQPYRPKLQACPRPSVGLPDAGFCLSFRAPSCLHTHLFTHKCWAIPPCPGPQEEQLQAAGGAQSASCIVFLG